MSDQEFLCNWMEPKPTAPYLSTHGSNEVWWRWGWRYVGPSLPQQETPVEYCWLPIKLTLNECHLIEARLTGDGTVSNPGQWKEYESKLVQVTNQDGRYLLKFITHATAEQKIKALASVLRQEVQG